MGASEHHAVMVRLVTVAIDQDDVARPDQRLHHDLVGGGGTIGDKVGTLGAEGARSQFLLALEDNGTYSGMRFGNGLDPWRRETLFITRRTAVFGVPMGIPGRPPVYPL